jgi:teichuronic acid biosynthesis glycosyltransferase TuaH
MNILVVPTTDWIHNPTPNRLNFIFDRLSERGHDVDVIHFKIGCYKNTTPRDTKCNLLPVHGFDLSDHSLYYILNTPFIVKTMVNATTTKKYDVVVAANILPAFYSNFIGIPVVHDYLDHWEESASACYQYNLTKSKVVGWCVNKISKYNLMHAKSIITVSDELRWMIIDKFFCLCDKNKKTPKITVISNGVDTSEIYSIDKKDAKHMLGVGDYFVIGYVGALESWVDFETLFDKIRGIGARNIKMLIVGSSLYGDYESYLKYLVKTKKATRYVIFAGPVKYSELYKYISAMDVGVNPLKPMIKNSYSLGGKIFNYLSCGVPVLSTYGDSIGKLAAKYPDTIYFPRKGDFVTSAVEIPPSTEDIREYRRAVAKKFDWNVITDSYEKVLELASNGEINND